MSAMTNDVSVELSEDQVLARTRGVRLKIVGSLTKTEQGFPADPDDAKLLVKVLDGLDKSALTTKRMKVDEAIAQGTAASGKELVAALLSRVSHAYNGAVTVVLEAPTLGSEIPDPELLPGEMDVGTKQLDYTTFMEQNGRPASPAA